MQRNLARRIVVLGMAPLIAATIAIGITADAWSDDEPAPRVATATDELPAPVEESIATDAPASQLVDSVDWTAILLGNYAAGGPPVAGPAMVAAAVKFEDGPRSTSPESLSGTGRGAPGAYQWVGFGCGDGIARELNLDPNETAAEILALRRRLGLNTATSANGNAVAGPGISWDQYLPAGTQLDELERERIMAATIRQLECERAQAETIPCPVGEPVVAAYAESPTDSQSLRAAEKKLEEAAALLESDGHYAPADAARELAYDVRQEARNRERQATVQRTSGVRFAR